MSATPLLRTERFDLWRPCGPSDLPGLCRLIADEETRRFLGPADPSPQPQWERLVRNAGSWGLYGYGTLLVRPRGDEEVIANCGIFHSWRGLDPRMDDEPEAGWIVRQDFWGQGVAGEVMRAVLAWFDVEHGPRRIVAMIEHGNTASQRLAAVLGFVPFGSGMIDGNTPIDYYERLPAGPADRTMAQADRQ